MDTTDNQSYPEDLNSKIQMYNQILKDGQNMFRLSPWGELKFDKIYVLPYLATTPEPEDQQEAVEENYLQENDVSSDDAVESIPVIENLADETPNFEASSENIHRQLQQRVLLPDLSNRDNISLVLDELQSQEIQEWGGLTERRKHLITGIGNIGRIPPLLLSDFWWSLPQKDFFTPDFSSDDIQNIHTRTERIEIIRHLFEKDDIIYIIGGAGYGKSLFLKMLCVNSQILTGFVEKPLLIIRGDIKKLVRDDGTHRAMQEFLEECFTHNSLCGSIDEDISFVTTCLKEGRCLLLLDALDEVGNEHRDALHDLIISHFTNVYPGNKVCITSRERGFIPRKHITCFHIWAVTPQDVEEYVDRFIRIGSFELEKKTGFLDEATELVNKKFAKGFLTVSLLLTIYHKEGSLPKNKYQLYEKCFEYMANLREKEKDMIRNSRTGQNYNWDRLDVLLTDETFMALAERGTPNNKDIPERTIRNMLNQMYKDDFRSSSVRKQAAEEFLQFCADRTEVFVLSQSSNSDYRFYHRSFYEFFYAKYIDNHTEDVDQIYEKLKPFDMDSEIYELLSMLYKCDDNEDKLNNLVNYLIEKTSSSLSMRIDMENHSFDMLIMFMHALEENTHHRELLQLMPAVVEHLAGKKLKVSFGMLSKVLSRDKEQLWEVLEKDGKNYISQVQDKLLQYYIKSPQVARDQLKTIGSKGFDEVTRDDLDNQRFFSFSEFILLMPNCYEYLDDIHEKFADRKYLIATKKLKHNKVDAICDYASKVGKLPPQKRIQVYHNALLKA